MVWSLLVPFMVYASSSKRAEQLPVAKDKVVKREQLTPEEEFFSLLDAVKSSVRGNKSLSSGMGGGTFCAPGVEIVRTKINIDIWSVISPLIEPIGKKYQIDDKGEEALYKALLAIANEKGVVRDRLYQRRAWVSKMLSHARKEYFTMEGLEKWKDDERKLLAICQRRVSGQCFQKLTARFKDLSKISNPKSEDYKHLAEDIREVRDAVVEMRRSRVRDAVTEGEMLTLMNSFSAIFPMSSKDPTSEKKQKKQDLLYSLGILEAFIDLIFEIYPMYTCDLLMEPILCDSDEGEVEWQLVSCKEEDVVPVQHIMWRLKYFKNNELIDICDEYSEDDADGVIEERLVLGCVSPKNRDNPRWMCSFREKLREKNDISQMILTPELHEWRSIGTRGAGEVMRSPWAHRLIKGMMDVIERNRKKQ